MDMTSYDLTDTGKYRLVFDRPWGIISVANAHSESRAKELAMEIHKALGVVVTCYLGDLKWFYVHQGMVIIS